VPRLIWSPPALLDMQRLHRFLADKSPDAARRAVNSIREGMKVISRQPGMGRPAEELEPEFREWLIDFGESGYVVLYRFEGQNAVILAIRHQKEAGY
jgi:plasmid stabilization system protein ParE